MKLLLDPRTKIALLILAAIYISLQVSITLEIILIFIFVAPLFLAGLHTWGLAFLAIYTVQLLAATFILPKVEQAFILYILSFSVHGFRLLLPSIIAGAYSMKTTGVNEWIAAFKKLHLPNWLLIPLAVMARFFPTIAEDYRHIRKAMAFRGIGTGFWDLVKHPFQTLEFILIPLLMNATQVAEDLTISSLTKGLGLPGAHTTIVPLKMKTFDWAYMGLALVPLILHFGGIFQ